ncbi:MAG: hypothetical protein R3321_10110 [Nitrososphaeraceae archaeon]|nr:hypothetical protein [Nitrososphaeraceae archaeon]
MSKKIQFPTVAGVKINNDVGMFILYSIIAGFTFGVGSVLGDILIRSVLKRIDIQTNILPPETKSELFKTSGSGGGTNAIRDRDVLFGMRV